MTTCFVRLFHWLFRILKYKPPDMRLIQKELLVFYSKYLLPSAPFFYPPMRPNVKRIALEEDPSFTLSYKNFQKIFTKNTLLALNDVLH